MSAEAKNIFLRQIHNPNLDYLRRKLIHKKIIESSKKITICLNCGYQNGVVKKGVGAILKIVHGDPIKSDSMNDFENARKDHRELNILIPLSKFDLLDPLKVYNIFNQINKMVINNIVFFALLFFKDIALLMVGSDEAKHPLDLLTTRVPVPPVCIRPSVVSDLKAGTNEDDLTMKLTEILLINGVLRKHKNEGAPMKTITETWDHLQVICLCLE